MRIRCRTSGLCDSRPPLLYVFIQEEGQPLGSSLSFEKRKKGNDEDVDWIKAGPCCALNMLLISISMCVCVWALSLVMFGSFPSIDTPVHFYAPPRTFYRVSLNGSLSAYFCFFSLSRPEINLMFLLYGRGAFFHTIDWETRLSRSSSQMRSTNQKCHRQPPSVVISFPIWIPPSISTASVQDCCTVARDFGKNRKRISHSVSTWIGS